MELRHDLDNGNFTFFIFHFNKLVWMAWNYLKFILCEVKAIPVGGLKLIEETSVASETQKISAKRDGGCFNIRLCSLH